MLSRLTDEDAVMRMSLEDRKREIEVELAELPTDEEHRAQAGIFFGGRPVIGSLGIESEFGGRAVSMIQDLVAKQFARESETGLGQRGPLPNKGASRLHVTGVLRRSFGFLLEELQPQAQLLDTSLKTALDQVTDLLAAFAERDEEKFEAAVENVDERVLKDVRDFFSYLNQEGATLRLVAGGADKPFDDDAVARAARRAVTTTVSDRDEEIVGQLAGVLPDGHLFEFRCEGQRGVIRGKVSRSLSATDAARLAADWVNKTAIGDFLVRQVVKEGRIHREAFTLRSIRPPGGPGQ